MDMPATKRPMSSCAVLHTKAWITLPRMKMRLPIMMEALRPQLSKK